MSSESTELPPPGSPDVAYLVDLSGYVFRAYHALPPLTSPTGEPTGATYGTVSMLYKLLETRRPARLAGLRNKRKPPVARKTVLASSRSLV